MNSTSTLYNSIFSGIHRFEVKVNIGSTDYGIQNCRPAVRRR